MLYHLDSLIAFIGIILLTSLIVTVLTQIFVAFFNLRGKNLLWGLKRLIVEVEPSLKAKAGEIVKKILGNPLISMQDRGRGFWGKIQKLPAVIRREEFSRLLIKLAESEDAKEFGEAAAQGLRDLTAIDPDELKKQLEALPADLGKGAEKGLEKTTDFLFDKFKAARVKLVELETWFDDLMERLGQRFTLFSRVIAVGGALLVTLLFRLDSIQVLKQTYTNQELRTQLLASVTGIQEMGNAVLGGPTLYDLAFQTLKEELPEFSVPGESVLTREDADRWLEAHPVSGRSPGKLAEDYEHALAKATKTKLGALGDDLATMKATLSEMSLQILGDEKTFWRSMNFTRILGILVSVLLLSLGAPFWFNALKNLTNLRTALMKNEEKERLKRQADQ